MIVYVHKSCSTCKKALYFLESQKLSFEKIDIVTCSPSKEHLLQMLHYLKGDQKKLFNTSGNLYREGSFKEKVPSMTVEEVLEVLSKEGMLIKRPFLLGGHFGLLGFKKEEWKKKLV